MSYIRPHQLRLVTLPYNIAPLDGQVAGIAADP